MSNDLTNIYLSIISRGSKQLGKSIAEVYLNKKPILPHQATQVGLNLLLLNSQLQITHFRFYNFEAYDLNRQLIKDLHTISPKTIIILVVRKDISKNLKPETRKYLQKHFDSKYIQKLGRFNSWAYLGKKVDHKIIRLAEAFQTNSKSAKIDNSFDLSFPSNDPKKINYSYELPLIRDSNIKKKVHILSQQIRKLKTTEAKIALMKDYFKGEKCYIISCAPSINDYDIKMIKRIAGKHLVFCIKQSYNLFEEICDFHITNFCNNIHYPYRRSDIIKIYQSNNKQVDPNSDLSLTLDQPYITSKFKSHKYKYPPLSKLMNFEDYLFEKTIYRPSGPGIMYEIPLYLAIHLGIKEVVVMGWDCSYKKPPTTTKRPDGTWNHIKVVNSHFYGSTSHTNREIEKIVNENLDIINSSKYFYLWLRQKGVDLKLASEKSQLDPIIPRIDLRNFYIPALEEDKRLNAEKNQKNSLEQIQKDLKNWSLKFLELQKNDQKLLEYKKKNGLK